MNRLANALGRRAWRVVLVAVVFVLVAGAFGAGGLGSLSTQGFDDPSSESIVARHRIEQVTGAQSYAGVIALVRPGSDVRTGSGRAAVERVVRELAGQKGVASVVGPFTGGGDDLVSRDGRSVYLAATIVGDSIAKDLLKRFDGDPQVTLGGGGVVSEQTGSIIGEDLAKAELLAFPLLFLISLWVFRGVVAAVLPPLMGAVVIMGGFLGIAMVNRVLTLSVYAVNLVIGLGLGLAIDYSLFVVSRYREEAARTGFGVEAMGRTLRSAGKTVLISAATVAGALASLMVFPQRFLFSMGLGGVFVALFAALSATILLPAVLLLLGPRLNSLAPSRWRRASEDADGATERGFWYRLSRGVMRRPGIVATVTAAALILAGLPALGLNFTTVDATVLPTSASARQVDDALRAEFPEDRTSPVILVFAAPGDGGAAAKINASVAPIASLPNVTGVTPARDIGADTWRVDVFSSTAPLSDATASLVRRIRATSTPFPRSVGGQAAGFIDQKSSLGAHLPVAIAIVAAVTLIVLFLMTGSVILPIKAVIMNLLTLSATLGILLLIFQDGRLEGLLSYTSQGGIDTTQPILLAALAFGLSTDYAVFLLSRIKEAHDAGMDDRDAVAVGLQRTGRIVTAAALLFCIAIGAFALSRIVILKELGIGTALAVAIDATIIRALLVPSLMAMLGRWNWWAPVWLKRVHRRVGLREGADAA